MFFRGIKVIILFVWGGILLANTLQEINYKNIEVSKAKILIEQLSPNIVIIDIRTADEFSSGHLKGAININYFNPDFADQIKELSTTHNYLLYCAAGMRTEKAKRKITDWCVPEVFVMDGGIAAWKSVGFEVE